jgi:hypothetical protein
MMTKEENFIQLKKDNILRIGIKDANGEYTGEHLEFDLEDIELPLKINEAEAKHRKNLEFVRNQFLIIDKKEDKKGKFLLSWKEEEKIKAFNEFYKKEMNSLDLFLGEGGTLKLLNGRKPYYSMYEDINEIIEPILPLIKERTESITDKIKAKYDNKKSDVIE